MATEYHPRQTFTEEQKEEARMLLAALRTFTAIRSTMPLQYVIAFLQIVVEEGHSISEYAVKAGVSQSVMSRHILDIGPRNRFGDGEGFQLIEQHVHPEQLRSKEIRLSPKGRSLYTQVRESVAHWKRMWSRGGK